MDKIATQRWVQKNGAVVLLEESHGLPIVDLDFAFRTGSVFDPKGREGTTRMMWRVLRMGTAKLDASQIEDRIASLGARISIQISTSAVRVQGVVIRRNLDPFMALLSELINGPAFRAADLGRARREALSEIISMRDDDRTLAARVFRRELFGKHPYARPLAGTKESLRRITPAHLRKQYEEHVTAKNLVVGVAGDVDGQTVRALLAKYFSDLRTAAAPKENLPEPKARKGRHVFIVDKADRTQTQILMGGLGSRVGLPDHAALVIANTAFGGTFTSRLTQEVREKRGWSYGASSHLGADRRRDAWYMSTAPGAADAVACVALELGLLEKFNAEGITENEFRRGRAYLINSHCFDLDTAPKRLEPRIDEEIFGLPYGQYAKHVDIVKKTKRTAVNRAVKKHLPNRDLIISLAATAKDIVPALEAMDGIDSVTVIPHTKV